MELLVLAEFEVRGEAGWTVRGGPPWTVCRPVGAVLRFPSAPMFS